VLDDEDLRDVVKVGFVLPPIGQQPIEAPALLGVLDAAFSRYFDADLMQLPRDGAVLYRWCRGEWETGKLPHVV